MNSSKNELGYFPQMPVFNGHLNADLNSDFTLPDYPDEWEKLRSAQGKAKSGAIMCSIGIIVTVLLLFILGCVAFVNAIS